jgi:hypothetical protein
MAEPYYRDEHVTLYLGDCREFTEWLDADVLITDPPYGTGKHGYGRRQLREAATDKPRTIAGDLDTTTRDAALASWGTDRPALVFGSPRLPDPPIAVQDRLVWDKRRLGTNGGPWRYRHETIYVTAGFERVSDGSSSILSAFPDAAYHVHGKPLPLMETLIQAAPAGVIADPFAGAGSTLVAAANLGRQAIGVELEERYCERLAERLAHATLNFAV